MKVMLQMNSIILQSCASPLLPLVGSPAEGEALRRCFQLHALTGTSGGGAQGVTGGSSPLQMLVEINPKGMCQLSWWNLNSSVVQRPIEAESREKLF